MSDIKITISIKTFLFMILIGMLLWGIIVAKDILLFLFAGYIIACAMFPVIDFLKKKIPYGLAIGIVFSLFILLLIVITIPFIGIFMEQIEQFNLYFPKITDKISEWIAIYNTLHLSFLPPTEQIVAKVISYSEGFLKTSLDLTFALFGLIVAVFTLAALVLFILLDRDVLKKGFLSFFPKDKRDYVEKIALTITTRIGGYVRGQLLVMFLVGLVTAITMQIIGLPFALLLGILAGILEVVPILGPILSALPAVMIAALISPWHAVIVIIAYLVIQRVENLVSPFIYGKFLEMPPLVIISVILLAGVTLGVFGVVLSPAIAAVIYVLIQELYLKKIN